MQGSDDVTESKYDLRKDGHRLSPGTYFVLRSSDRFAYGALWQYAQVLQMALEVDHSLTAEEQVRIMDLIELTETTAQRWQAVKGRVPD